MKTRLPLTTLLTTLLATTALALPVDGSADNLRTHRDRSTRSGVELGIYLSNYPDLVVIPGMPVLYDPRLMANYFFYEGSFWVFEDDDWYRSDWYNGPWMLVDRNEVPVFLLRIPVRYYNRAPLYFRPWANEMPPRWSLRWGRDWERRHRNWDRWERRNVPPPAPPPLFQRQFPRERYPESPDVQQRLREKHYRYRPREPVSPPPLQPQPVRPPTRQAPNTQPAPQAPQQNPSPPQRLHPLEQQRHQQQQQQLQQQQQQQQQQQPQPQKEPSREHPQPPPERERRERPPGAPPRA